MVERTDQKDVKTPFPFSIRPGPRRERRGYVPFGLQNVFADRLLLIAYRQLLLADH
jgi:hypothetical protein